MKIIVTTQPPDGNNKCYLKALLLPEKLTFVSHSLLSRFLYIIWRDQVQSFKQFVCIEQTKESTFTLLVSLLCFVHCAFWWELKVHSMHIEWNGAIKVSLIGYNV